MLYIIYLHIDFAESKTMYQVQIYLKVANYYNGYGYGNLFLIFSILTCLIWMQISNNFLFIFKIYLKVHVSLKYSCLKEINQLYINVKLFMYLFNYIS